MYIRFLGIEAFGLIGFYLMFQTLLQVLDLGLSPTMNREMARYSVQQEKADEARDLVRTLEVGYWGIGILIGAALVAVSPWVATHWIAAGATPVSSVKQAVTLMGLLAVFQWPISFYQGGLFGLGKQIPFNVVRVIAATASSGGAVLVLRFVSPTIQAFFLWLVAMNAVQVVLLTIILWKCLPPATRTAQFDLSLVRNIGRFAAGVSGITAFALILTQTDKVIVSKLLSLRVLGYYTLAGMFGTGLSMIVGSVFNMIYPRFSTLVAVGDEETLKDLYHRCTQMMVVFILPLGCVLAVFSIDILQMWTQNPEVARNAGPIATLLVIGTALNGLMSLPYALQLAHGWTSIGLKITIVLTVVVVPAIWFMTKFYGAVGAASVWLLLNVSYVAIGVPLTHRRLLKGEARRWFGDVGLPLVPVVLVTLLGRALIESPMSMAGGITALSAVLVCAVGAATLASPLIRPWLVDQVVRAKA
jgi:O-antigen/teichoic acid export membrane protein